MRYDVKIAGHFDNEIAISIWNDEDNAPAQSTIEKTRRLIEKTLEYAGFKASVTV